MVAAPAKEIGRRKRARRSRAPTAKGTAPERWEWERRAADPRWIPRSRRVAVVVAALLVIGLLTRTTWMGPVVGIAAVLVVGASLFLRSSRDNGSLRLLLAGALLARIVVAAADSALGLFEKHDAVGYHIEASRLAQSIWNLEPWLIEASPSVRAYVRFLGAFYVTFGPSMFLGRVVSAVLGTMTVVFVQRIGATFFSNRVATAGAAAYAFLPTLVLLDGDALRDPLIATITAGWILFLVKGTRRAYEWPLIGAAMAYLFFLRQASFVVAIVPLVVILVARLFATAADAGGERVPRRSIARAGIALLGIATVMGFFVAVRNLDLLDPSVLSTNRANLAVGGSAYLADVRFETWGDVLWFAPVGAVFFLLVPFPWHIHNVLALMAVCENLLWYFPAVVFALKNVWAQVRTPNGAAIVLWVLAGAVGFGLTEGNVGTAMRHRAQFIWAFFVFAAPSLHARLSPLGRRVWAYGTRHLKTWVPASSRGTGPAVAKRQKRPRRKRSGRVP